MARTTVIYVYVYITTERSFLSSWVCSFSTGLSPSDLQQQQVPAGLWAAAAGLNEASLMAQEENWSTRTNTRSSLPPWLSCTFHTVTQSVWSCVLAGAVFSEEWVGGALQAQLLRDAAMVNVKSRLSGHPVDENSAIKSMGQNRITLVRAMSWLRWHLTVEIQQTSSLFHLWPTAPTRCPSHAAARTHLPLFHI